MPRKIVINEGETAPKPKGAAPKKSWWKIGQWSRRTKIGVSVGGVLVLLASALTAWMVMNKDSSSNLSFNILPTPTPFVEPKDTPNPLNGELYTATEAAAFANLRPMAVMVENHVDARPQSGLSQADVVYEALAEGGITRFMAVYLAHQPAKVGPVRSARMHYVSWASGYDGAYAHWGGSAEAQAYLRSHSRPVNLDQFQLGSQAFWRANNGKSLEHTGYTDVTKLRAVLVKQGKERAVDFTGWSFKDEDLEKIAPISQTVRINFLNGARYIGQFDYRPETNDYARSTGGSPHLDDQGQVLTAKTVVLMRQKFEGYTDASGHPAVRVTTTGSGDAVFIQDGVAVEGRWSKSDFDANTSFSTLSGQPMELNRGRVWVVSVPIGSAITY